MKALKRIFVAAILVCAFVFPSVSLKAEAAQITTTATGYTKASQVKYNESGMYIANWGARGEDCVFLSKYAQSFYTGSYVYDTLSQKQGGSTQSNASSSALYSSLKTLMSSKHKKTTSYSETKEMYRYTDCVSNDTAHISSFYSGKQLTGNWDGAETWNREHTWPKSKGLGGNDANDIIMLRPTWVSENSSRGNTAYGASSGYYDPGESTRGDCARIFLYVYTRWGITSSAWGKSGVMESMNVLLKWMEEDPVDTWEMGRNDVVEDITGTRNVFVDYPEYAWLLFGKEIPEGMSTPSGMAMSDRPSTDSSSESSSSSEKPSQSSSEEKECEHEYGKWFTIIAATATTEGKRRCTCTKCGDMLTEIIPMLGSSSVESGTDSSVESGTDSSVEDSSIENSSVEEVCEHECEKWFIITKPTETTEGKRRGECVKCGELVTEMIPALGSSAEESSSTDSEESEESEESFLPEDSVTDSEEEVVSSEEVTSGEESKDESSEVTTDSEVKECVHEYTDWFVDKAATATEEGERRCHCWLCGDTQIEKIPVVEEEATDSSLESSTAEDEADTSLEESSVEESSTAVCAHEYSAWFAVKAPLNTEKGDEYRFCKHCGVLEYKKVKTNQGTTTMMGCSGSVGSCLGGLVLAVACAFVYKNKAKL